MVVMEVVLVALLQLETEMDSWMEVGKEIQ